LPIIPTFTKAIPDLVSLDNTLQLSCWQKMSPGANKRKINNPVLLFNLGGERVITFLRITVYYFVKL
jgi:hypothetical protein